MFEVNLKLRTIKFEVEQNDFDILNHLDADHECDGKTNRQMDRHGL